MIPEKITFRLGDLAGPLGKHCDEHGVTPSDAVREAVAKMLGVDAPTMVSGNPDIGDHAKAGAAARWRPKRRRR